MALFSGQGKVYIAQRNATTGAPGAFRYLGQTNSNVKISAKTDKLTRKESETGQRLTTLSLITGKELTLDFEIMEFTKENLALAFWGASATIAAGTVTNELSPTGLVAGDFFRLSKVNVSTVSITDSAGTPASLTLNTHYTVENAADGLIKMVNVGTFVQPFKVNYSNAVAYNVPLFNTTPGNYWVRFEGLNMANSGEPVLVELYNVQIDPTSGFNLKSDDVSSFPMTGNALYDATKASDAVLGTMGRVVTLS